MINITTNIPKKPTVTSVPLSSLPVGTVVQFTPGRAKETFDIDAFGELKRVWVKGIVIKPQSTTVDTVTVLRFMNALGDDSAYTYDGDTHVVPLEVKSMELNVNFR